MVVRRTQLAGWLLRSHDCFVSVVSRQRAGVVFSSFAGSYFPLQLLSSHSFHPSSSCLIVQCTRVSFVSWFGHLGNISWVWSEPYFTSYHVSIFNLFSCHNVLRFIISFLVCLLTGPSGVVSCFRFFNPHHVVVMFLFYSVSILY